jgi:hypothetical protein
MGATDWSNGMKRTKLKEVIPVKIWKVIYPPNMQNDVTQFVKVLTMKISKMGEPVQVDEDTMCELRCQGPPRVQDYLQVARQIESKGGHDKNLKKAKIF